MSEIKSPTGEVYYPVIGLEIHAELNTSSKMFSSSKNDPDEELPNININPVDVGHPGTLPTINKKAVEHMIKIGLAVNGTIANFTEFDRKNYFYPDIPKGYQISQYKYPIVSGGVLAGVDITRIHLEEDTGLSKHDRGDFSLVDFNRAGVPLMELVTEPVISSSTQATDFARELQLLLRYLGVAEANMEKSEMRVEVNISVSKQKGVFGTKVEVKNINSFKSVEKAIEFELDRMISLYEAGLQDQIVQETRGWDEVKQKTFSQRKKETSGDYRYFPEPDLPKLYLHELFDLEKIGQELPETPAQMRIRFAEQYNLPIKDIEIFIQNKHLVLFFEDVAQHISDMSILQKASNFILSDIVYILDTQENSVLPHVKTFVSIVTLFTDNQITSRGAKDMLLLAMTTIRDIEPLAYATANGLIQKNNTDEIIPIAQKIIDAHPDIVAEYKAGKDSILQFFVGQIMKETKGSANPKITMDILKELLNK
jgi:aspartyl-tRNA(Asn)/glutamyl-tRNA(Gln) amidotransferase subunit B